MNDWGLLRWARLSTYVVFDVDASVNNVDGGSFSCAGIIGIFLQSWSSPVTVGNTIKSPWRADANGQVVGGDFHILVDISHLFRVSIMSVPSNSIAN